MEFMSKNSNLGMEENIICLNHSINSLLPDFQKKIIQFIGSRKGEGTSTIVRDFAMVSANKFGKSVLLLDADMHRLSQHQFFNIRIKYSLEETVRGGEPLDMALHQIVKSRLFVGSLFNDAVSASQLFNSYENGGFWEKIGRQFDLILIDSGPASTSWESLFVSRMANGVILILEAEKTPWPIADRIKDKIIKSGGKILGVVFNKRRYHIPGFVYRRL